MTVETITEAKAQLSYLVSAVEKGEEVIIKRAGKPVAVLSKYDEGRIRRKPGAFQGKIVIHDDFDLLPQDLMEAFGMVGENEPAYKPHRSREGGDESSS